MANDVIKRLNLAADLARVHWQLPVMAGAAILARQSSAVRGAGHSVSPVKTTSSQQSAAVKVKSMGKMRSIDAVPDRALNF
jgi:hypothetical protein